MIYRCSGLLTCFAGQERANELEMADHPPVLKSGKNSDADAILAPSNLQEHQVRFVSF